MAGQPVTVFDQGKSHVYLSIDSPQLANLSYPTFITGDALNDLKRCFKLMTGHELPAAAADGLIPLRLVMIDPAADAKADHPLGRQGYEIRISDKEIVITAPTKLGVGNGIYHLLDGWGCRWIMPTEDGEFIPKQSTLTLPAGVQRHTRYMDQRFDGGQDAAGNLWRARNGCGLEGWITFQHYFHYFFPPEEYFKDHPEFYAWRAGARRPVQLETANPQVIELMIQKARELLRSTPGRDSVPVDWDDNIDYSVSPESLALDPPNNPRFLGVPSMTDRAVRVANAVAEGIEKEFPGKIVGFYAYTHHTLPPVAVKPRPNVGVGVTRAGFSSIRYMPDPKDADSMAYWKVLSDWLAICNHVYTYDYDPIPRTEGLPSALILQRAEAIKKQYAMGVKGNYTDKVTANLALQFADYYLEYRIKADPSRDPKTELKQLCDVFFGPAAEGMYGYYLALDAASHVITSTPSTDWTVLAIKDYFTPEILSDAAKHLDTAARAAKDSPTIARRVQMVRQGFETLENTIAGFRRAESNDYGGSVAAFARAVQSAEKLNAMGEGLVALDRFKTVLDEAKLKTLAKYFPQRFGYQRSWLLLGPVPNDYRDAQWYEEDFPKALFPDGVKVGQPVKLTDGKTANWISYTSPEGQIAFSDAFENIKRDWHFSSAHALLAVQSPATRKVQFRLSSFNPMRLFLNGKQVYEQLGWDSDPPDQRIITVDLNTGLNLIVISGSEYCWQSPVYRWGFYFRITDTNGNLVTDLRTSSQIPDVAKAWSATTGSH
ncbi:MAG: DUF4838 domain-containing protein [Phycisphaerales bacterium]|nr:DUF4838 domain-containing protein [Phycisphaerales bacterium]